VGASTCCLPPIGGGKLPLLNGLDEPFCVLAPGSSPTKCCRARRGQPADASWGADRTIPCVQQEARAAGLTGTFRALLATLTASASSRFGAGPWFRVDGVQIDLPVPIAAINVTADGTYLAPRVWTGGQTALVAGTDATTCADWSSVASDHTGREGRGQLSGPAFFDTAASTSCSIGEARLYCLEI
jgi:hypothetical protein